MTRPPLSIVVAPVQRGTGLAGCLEALAGQQDVGPVEILVPVDHSVDGLEDLRSLHPKVTFFEVPDPDNDALSGDLGRIHLAIDRRRSAGLAAATGDVIALTEEFARPDPDWCAQILEAHREAHEVIGGAIENANPAVVNWALYFSDAGRYQNPLPGGPAHYVSDMNVSYKRDALHRVGEVWREVYHEAGLHDALREAGGTFG